MAEEEELVSHLKQVFELCDETQRGYLDADQLRELGRIHLGGREEDMVQLLQCLDPKGLGLVTFNDFYKGVVTVMRIQGSGHNIDAVPTQVQNALNLSNTSTPLVIGSPDMMTDIHIMNNSSNNNNNTLSSIDGITRNGVSVNVMDDLSHSRISPYLSDNEEKFECYGEGDDVDDTDGILNGLTCPATPQSELDGHGTKPSLSSDSFHSNSSIGSTGSGGGGRNSSRNTPFNQRNTWLRTSLRRQSGSSKRLSSNALASQLFRNGTTTPSSHSLNNGSNSRRSSLSCDSDEMYTDQISLEDDVLDLNQKVHELQQQVSTLSESQYNNDDRYSRVKQENAALMSRIHTLEEQIRELEIRSEERAQEEERRLKDSMARQEREKNQELEHFTSRLYTLQQEHLEVKDELIKIRAQADRLRQEKLQAESELCESRSELSALHAEHQKFQDLSRREREDLLQERNGNAQLLNELTIELEELRRYRRDNEAALNSSRSRSPSVMSEIPARCLELEQEVRQLREESAALREANEELQAQLLNNSLAEGKHLLSSPSSSSTLLSHSIAEEFDSLTKDQLMEALREQQDVNSKLRAYIDNILLNIVENYPQLLEVKSVLSK